MRVSKKLSIISALVLLVIQLVFQIHLAKVDSQTTDEGIHLYAGYKYLTEGDFSYNPEHPPLIKYLAGVPLLFLNLKQPTNDKELIKKNDSFFFWGDFQQDRKTEEDFLYNSGNDAKKILFLARVPMTFVTMLLGGLVFTIAVYGFGWTGGLVAVALYVLDPTIAGHGHLVTTDIGFAFGTLLSLFTLWLFLNKRTWKNVIFFGLSLGITLLTKFSAILLFPIFFILIGYFLFQKRKELNKDVILFFLSRLGVSFLIAWAVLIAGYGFKFNPPQPTESVVQSILITNNIGNQWIPDTTFINESYKHLRYIIVPGDYFRGLFSFLNHASSGHRSYLLGEVSEKGWRYYFPLLFTAKLFILPLIMLIMGAFVAIKYRREHCFGFFLFVSFVLYVGISTTSKVNIGIRHIMPAFPLAYIVISGLTNFSFKKYPRLVSTAISITVIVSLFEFVSIYPHYLSYFNQLYGGSWNGYKTAVDSNLDWGQDLYRIKSYIDKNGIDGANLYLDYYWAGLSALSYFGISYNHLADFDRDKDHGFIIISATSLIQEKYLWLRDQPPYDRISPSVFVYKL